MTEAEWLRSDGPEAMVKHFRSLKASQRKMRLFGCAYCRRIWDSISDHRSRSAVAVAESFADGLADVRELEVARVEAREAYLEHGTDKGPPYDAHYATGACVCVASKKAGEAAKAWYGAFSAVQMRRAYAGGHETPLLSGHPIMRAAWAEERAAQATLVRDIFGNPFRPVAVDPSWLTSTVVRLAEGIYQDRAFDRMPILADALQDSGCEHDEILNHCRHPGEHVRGCWVVDLLLGKE